MPTSGHGVLDALPLHVLALLGMTCLLIGNALGSQGFEPTGERMPFAALKERNERDEEMDEKVVLARSMREEGMSYSQIAEALGYKSKTSVMKLLREEE